MWPITLYGDEILLRPARYRDRSAWNNVRAENKEWLTPWEATLPLVPHDSPAYENQSRPSYFEMVHLLHREARAGRSYSFLIWNGHNLIGQITMGGVMHGALRGAPGCGPALRVPSAPAGHGGSGGVRASGQAGGRGPDGGIAY